MADIYRATYSRVEGSLAFLVTLIYGPPAFAGRRPVKAPVGDPVDGLDWGDLLLRTGYDGTYLVEYEPLHDTLDGIRRSLAALEAAGFELEY